MDEITSFTLKNAFKSPGTMPQSAPARIAARSAARQLTPGGRNVNLTPTYTAANAPAVNCPDAPILNNPVLNANPTESPVMISGVAIYSTCPNPCIPSVNPP